MKKILPYIFITLILVNLLAPFGVTIDKESDVVIKKNTAEAEFSVKRRQVGATDHSINIELTLIRTKTKNHSLYYIVTDKNGTSLLFPDQSLSWIVSHQGSINFDAVFKLGEGARKIAGDQIPNSVLTSGTDTGGGVTTLVLPLTIEGGMLPDTPYYLSMFWINGDSGEESMQFAQDLEIRTAAAGKENSDVVDLGLSSTESGFLPSCGISLFGGTLGGCIAQILHHLLFKPTSYLFGLAGIFFDNTFGFSVDDKSYSNSFVIEGWGVVRDFVNVFFIFVLLYIAFATILSLHGFKTKEMIINVVIIGLLINFSLFATKVIIDSSNILARVFYNSETIKVKVKGQDDTNKAIPISEAIVSKVNPQRLIIDARTTSLGTGDGLSTGTIILIILLCVTINIIGMIVFLTVGLIFLSRVVGLWLAMILVPFAFFSYTVPSMQDIPMLGWKKWWPETLKLAFLAPIFMFFLYLIIKFLSIKDLIKINETSGPGFIVSVIAPFLLIIILLNTAKKLAVKFSGDIGSAVTKAAVIGGGVALGGAALTGAAIGRQTLGSVNKYVQNDNARDKDRKLGTNVKSHFTDEIKNKWNPIAYLNAARKTIVSTGKAGAANVAVGLNKIGREKDPNTGQIIKKGWMQRQVASVKDRAHAEHELNEAAQKVTNNKEATYKELDGPDAQKARDMVDRDIVAKAEFNGLGWDKLKANERATLEFNHKVVGDPNGEWSHSADNIAHANGGHAAGEMAKSLKTDVAMGEFIQSLRKGSYDIRELSKIKKGGALTGVGLGAAALFGGVFMPIGLALAASTSSAIKKGLKSATGGMDHGTAQKDFFKDLSNTLSTALKSVKIDVKTDDHGHTEAKASGGHGGGGGHH